MTEKRKFKNPEEAERHMMESIIENFDFEKCERVMKHLNWRWGLAETPVTIEMLKKSAMSRMKSAIVVCKERDHNWQLPGWTSSGGLKATAWKNNYGHITQIELEFILTEWESDGDY